MIIPASKIRVVREPVQPVSAFNDIGLDMYDFYSDDDIRSMQLNNIKWHILRGKILRGEVSADEHRFFP